jgi:glutamate/tyrosine decarboxylase-like PLP-dependent enzyme
MARELSARIAADARFEICAPTVFSVVCFRLRSSNAANRALLDAVNSAGQFYISATVAGGRTILRIAVGNMLTTRGTLDELWTLIDGLTE